MSFSSLTMQEVGKLIHTIAKVKDVYQTSGPTLFTLFDGTSNLTAKGFLSPGKRAFPLINKDDVVDAKLRIQEYDGEIEAEIIEMKKSDSKTFQQTLDNLHIERTKIEPMPFLVKNPILEKLRDRLMKAAQLIKQSIYEERPILIRHNADCDGYAGAVALERAILPLIFEFYKDEHSKWRYYRRVPSRAPYYGVSDSLFDATSTANDMARYNSKPPLLIIVDNGSGPEDLPGISAMKIYGCPVIVVDHHYFAEDVITSAVDININPYLVGGNADLCSGMLCTEIARHVNIKAEHLDFLPALAGTGDKITDMNDYLAIAKKQGYDNGYLKRLSLTIDFVAYYLRGNEARSLIDDLLGNNKDRQDKALEILWNEANERRNRLIKAAEKYADIKEKKKGTLAILDLQRLSNGEFPPYGKMTGMLSDWLNETRKNVFVLGISDDMVVFRVSKGSTFSIHRLLEELNKQHIVSGGGHDRAGTIRFLPVAKEEVVDFITDYIDRFLNK